MLMSGSVLAVLGLHVSLKYTETLSSQVIVNIGLVSL